MSKFYIAGSCGVIQSTATLEELKLLEKSRPKALSLYEDGDNGAKVEMFRVGTTNGEGSVTPFGISFGRESLSGNGQATVTVSLPDNVKAETVADYVVDKYGAALNHLNEVEANLKDALEAVKLEQANILTHIVFMQ